MTFAPVQDLRPGARAEWRVHVRAAKPGDVRTRVELSSRYLKDEPVPDVEPTRLVR